MIVVQTKIEFVIDNDEITSATCQVYVDGEIIKESRAIIGWLKQTEKAMKLTRKLIKKL